MTGQGGWAGYLRAMLRTLGLLRGRCLDMEVDPGVEDRVCTCERIIRRAKGSIQMYQARERPDRNWALTGQEKTVTD